VGRERGEKREFMEGREMRMLEKNSPKMQLICLYLYLRLMGCVAMSAKVTHMISDQYLSSRFLEALTVDRWCFNDRLWEFVPFIDDPDAEEILS